MVAVDCKDRDKIKYDAELTEPSGFVTLVHCKGRLPPGLMGVNIAKAAIWDRRPTMRIDVNGRNERSDFNRIC